MSTRGDNLCVCFTPLNVLIARRIADSLGHQFSRAVYLTSVDNEKHRHYVEVMKEFCQRVDFVVIPFEDIYSPPKYLSILLQRIKYKRLFRQYGPVHTVYAPTSINHFIYALLSAVKLSKLVTFDDGLANIQPHSPFAARTHLWSKALYLAAGLTYWLERVRTKTVCHYSIYNADNVYGPTVHLKLVGTMDQHASSANDTKVVKLFLGPLPEASPEVWKTVQDAVRLIQPDAYLPHPRELQRMVEAVTYLETPLVAEDYVLSHLVSDPQTSFRVYGYDSSALFNLAGTPRVEVLSVIDDVAENRDLVALMKRCSVAIA